MMLLNFPAKETRVHSLTK